MKRQSFAWLLALWSVSTQAIDINFPTPKIEGPLDEPVQAEAIATSAQSSETRSQSQELESEDPSAESSTESSAVPKSSANEGQTTTPDDQADAVASQAKGQKNTQTPLDIEPTDADAEAEAEKPEPQCANSSSQPLRKRLASLAFSVLDYRDTVDLPYIGEEYSRQLGKHLNSDQLHFVDASDILISSFDPQSKGQIKILGNEILRRADELDSQFIVYGELLDWSFERDSQRLWHWTDSPRNAAVRLHLIDATTGYRIAERAFETQAMDPIFTTDKARHLDTMFFTGEFGQAVDGLMQEQARWLEQELYCQPMKAQVIAVDGGDIYIDAGLQNKLVSGQQLSVIRRVKIRRLFDRPVFYQTLGTLTLDQVQPSVAKGRVETQQQNNLASVRVQVGDWVQSY